MRRVSKVRITFWCTACSAQASVTVRWGEHHCLPKGWRSRDVVPTVMLARRTDHIFACAPKCQQILNVEYPPPKRPKWFRYA